MTVLICTPWRPMQLARQQCNRRIIVSCIISANTLRAKLLLPISKCTIKFNNWQQDFARRLLLLVERRKKFCRERLITDAKDSLQECRRVSWHFLGRGSGIAVLLGGFGFIRIRADLLAEN